MQWAALLFSLWLGETGGLGLYGDGKMITGEPRSLTPRVSEVRGSEGGVDIPPKVRTSEGGVDIPPK